MTAKKMGRDLAKVGFHLSQLQAFENSIENDLDEILGSHTLK